MKKVCSDGSTYYLVKKNQFAKPMRLGWIWLEFKMGLNGRSQWGLVQLVIPTYTTEYNIIKGYSIFYQIIFVPRKSSFVKSISIDPCVSATSTSTLELELISCKIGRFISSCTLKSLWRNEIPYWWSAVRVS